MAFTLKKLALWASEGVYGTAQQQWSYWENATLATITASAYMNDASDRLQKDDLIWVVGSDDAELFKVTSTTGATPVTLSQVTGSGGNLPLTQDYIFQGNGSNVATGYAVTGDIALSAGVSAVVSIDLESATVTNIADTEIMIGTGAGTANFAALSQDVTMDNTGAVTIANDAVTTAKINDGAVTQAKIAANSLDMTVAANLANDNNEAALSGWVYGEIAGGATSNKDIVMTHKVRVLGYKVYVKGLGTSADNVQIFNGTGANNISDPIDISSASTNAVIDETTGTINVTNWEIAAAGTLRVTLTDGGGSDVPAINFAIQVARVA